MLVQSGGGKVYAIIANNDHFELGLLPQISLVSTTIFLAVRFRYKALKADVFDPMLVPKKVLVGGVERSKDTLRGTVMMASGFTIEKVGMGFPELVSKKLFAAMEDLMLPPEAPSSTWKEGAEEVCLYAHDRRDDFVTDFGQLLASAIEPIYPAKDFSKAPVLMNDFDMQLFMASAAAAQPPSPFTAMDGGKVEQPDTANVKKFPFGAPSPQDVADKGVDDPNIGGLDSDQTGPDADAKIKLFGSAPKQDATETEGADH